MTSNNLTFPQAFISQIKGMVVKELDMHYTGFQVLNYSVFPADEFDIKEAMELAELLKRIFRNGYSTITEAMGSPTTRKLLDTAAQYGQFVNPRIGMSYCGVFIIAELNMEPSSEYSFFYSLLQFINAIGDVSVAEKQDAVFLMHIARAVRMRPIADERDLAISLEKTDIPACYAMSTFLAECLRHASYKSNMQDLGPACNRPESILSRFQVEFVSFLKKQYGFHWISATEKSTFDNVLFSSQLETPSSLNTLLANGGFGDFAFWAHMEKPQKHMTYEHTLFQTPFFEAADEDDKCLMLFLLKFASALRGCNYVFEEKLYAAYFDAF